MLVAFSERVKHTVAVVGMLVGGTRTVPEIFTSLKTPKTVDPVSDTVAAGLLVLIKPRARAACVMSTVIMSYSFVVALYAVVPVNVDVSSFERRTETTKAAVG